MAFERKNKASFADIISFCNETKSERGYSPVSMQNEIQMETVSLHSKSSTSFSSERAWRSPVQKEALELSNRKRYAVLNMIEKNWKVNIRSKIENDLSNQVQEALAPLVSHQKRWSEKQKTERQKGLQMFKVNGFHRSKFASRFSSDSSSTGGNSSFKYIDVNYIPPNRLLAGASDSFYTKDSFPRSLNNLRLPRRNGVPTHSMYGLDEMARSQKHAGNMRGGLDVTLLDSHSSVNFLSLPKQEDQPNGLRPLVPNVITYNGLSLPNYGANRRCFQTYTKEGMNNLLSSRTRKGKLTHLGNGRYADKRGVIISRLGPFWPQGYGPVCPCPEFITKCPIKEDLLPVSEKNGDGANSNGVKTTNNNTWLTKPRPVPEGNGTVSNQSDNNAPEGNQTTIRADIKEYTKNLSANHTKNNPNFEKETKNCNSDNKATAETTEDKKNNQPTDNRLTINNNSKSTDDNVAENQTSLSKQSLPNQKSLSHLSPRDAPLIRVVGNQGQKRQGQNGGKPIWRGKPVIYDSERSSRSPLPHSVPDGMDESLIFESRFESGNLRQVRRIAEFEYELVLRTDMYTNRHTQWYYFRMQKAKKDRAYKFSIINFLKKDSLYNYGMKPLIYSEKMASDHGIGWHRIGENIRYAAWTNPTRNAILSLDMQYYCLEFELEFGWDEIEDDTIYLAHCYPYTYSDLRRHLDHVMSKPELSQHVKKEVLCETTAGNACFLLTITEFPDREKDKYKDFHQEKKGVVITARVHPGESQASWMMKGVIDHLISDHHVAKQLREKFVFKIVPMLNPDGVIVGNYRTSLAARDLNRNYRHPKQGIFPTVWHTKQMVDQFNRDHPIALYCDLHGHSRKHMVFMYGCERKALYQNIKNNKKTNQSADDVNCGKAPDSLDETRDFVEERMFPWLMHKLAPGWFSFHGTKFAVRRSKESTGRVVMFRQMGIWNSFTMEASFSGTKKDNDAGRHFNIDDFQLIGRRLCDCVLEYSRVCENPIAKSRAILDMTRDIAQQLIQSRTISTTLPPSVDAQESKQNNVHNVPSKKMATTNRPMTNTNGANMAASFANIKSTIAKQVKRNQAKPIRDSNAISKDENKTKQENAVIDDVTDEDFLKRGDVADKERFLYQSNDLSVDGVSGRAELTYTSGDAHAIEGSANVGSDPDESCYRLLQSLNVHQMELESETSSESNSDSEPEVPVDAPSSGGKGRKSLGNADGTRKKKKKKRQQKFGKSISAPSNIQTSNKKSSDELQGKDSKSKAAIVNYPGYVNKYANRSNGGIPIFAQERMKERAERRLAELRIAEEDRKQQEKQLREQLLLAGIQDGPNIAYEIPIAQEEIQGYSEICGVRYKVSNQQRRVQYMVYNPYRAQSPNSARDSRPLVTVRFSPPSQLRNKPSNDALRLNKQYGERTNELYMPYRVQAPAGRLSNQRGLSSLTEFTASLSEGSRTEPSSSQSSERDEAVDEVTCEEGDSLQESERFEPRSVVVPVQKYNVSFKMYQKPWMQKSGAGGNIYLQKRPPNVEELDLSSAQQDNATDEDKIPPSNRLRHANVSELFLPPNMDVHDVMTAHMRYPAQVHRIEAMRPLPRGRTISRGPPTIFGEPIAIAQKNTDSVPMATTDVALRQQENSFTKPSLISQAKPTAYQTLLRHDHLDDDIMSIGSVDDDVTTAIHASKIKQIKNKPQSLKNVPRFVALAPPRGDEKVGIEKGNLTERSERSVKQDSNQQPFTVR